MLSHHDDLSGLVRTPFGNENNDKFTDEEMRCYLFYTKIISIDQLRLHLEIDNLS